MSLEQMKKVLKYVLWTSNEARNLGVIMESDLNFTCTIEPVMKSVYCNLKNISTIEGLKSQSDLEKMLPAFIFRKLDHCNCNLLTRLPKRSTSLRQLQLIQIIAAQVLSKTGEVDHISHCSEVCLHMEKLLLVFMHLVCGTNSSRTAGQLQLLLL